ncbi:hypothetical protein PCK1_000882 [Pneumocystis canis]|nr:hypothetical protein PCK1_000882 [Pneumocystis canis]
MLTALASRSRSIPQTQALCFFFLARRRGWRRPHSPPMQHPPGGRRRCTSSALDSERVLCGAGGSLTVSEASGVFGKWLSHLWGQKEIRVLIFHLRGQKEIRVLMLGLDGADPEKSPSKTLHRLPHPPYKPLHTSKGPGRSIQIRTNSLKDRKDTVKTLSREFLKAGKTTILYKMQVGEVMTTVPTIGFNMETVCYKNIKFNVWDLGGQTSIRPYWRCYYTSTRAIIYVIDSTDAQRLSATAKELHALLQEKELLDIDLLIFANKQDISHALNATEISEKLNLTHLRHRNWTIISTSAITGEGLMEGLDWLVNAIKNRAYAS